MALEQEISELKAKHAEKEAELIREHGILQHFAEFSEYARPMIHFYRLYGRRGGVNFNFSRFRLSTEKHKDNDGELLRRLLEKFPAEPDNDGELLRRLLEKFPAEPKVMYRDGCLGFRPEVNALEAKAKADERNSKVEITEVEPVTVKIDPAHFSNSVKFEWYTMLDGEIWEIEVEFPIYHTDIGKLTLRYDYYHDHEVRRVLECDFRPNTGQRIRYARGDEKTPNSFVVYWLRSLQKPHYPSMVKGGA